MQKIYCFENAINFIKKEIASFSLLILLSVTAYSHPIDKNTGRKTGYNFLPERPSFTSWPNSKGEVSYSTDDCTYTLSANREATIEPGSGVVTVTAGETCAWKATTDAYWITLTSGQSGTGSGSVGYSYRANMAETSRTGTITIADKTFTITQAGRPLIADSYEPNNTIENATLLTVAFIENASSVSISATCHNSTDIDIYKINLGDRNSSYTISGILFNAYNSYVLKTNYTLAAQSYYSTGGSDWIEWGDREFSETTVPGGIFYLKIEPYSKGRVGTYAARIDLKKTGTIGCVYALSSTRKGPAAEAGTGQIRVNTGASCFWAATSNVSWITLTSGQSGTGSGSTGYSYTANTTLSSRTGTVSMAGRTYTVTQLPSSLTPDGYEANNTIAQASLLTAPFSGNTSALSLSANCHRVDDTDIYKINLGAEYSYTISGTLYGKYKQLGNSQYTLNAQIFYSTDGSTWKVWWEAQLSVEGGKTFYLKIEPSSHEDIGTYGASINISRTAACTYSLSSESNQAAPAAGTGRVTVTAGSLCTSPRTAVSNANWITLTSGQQSTGSGNVDYTYTANITQGSRTGTITIARQTYTLTQAGTLPPDSYEVNNTVAEADLHPLTPTFTQQTGTLSISANCHSKKDVDIYKINLGTDFYIFNVLYKGYQLRMTYSTDGSGWHTLDNGKTDEQFLIPAVQEEAVYLKIEPYDLSADYDWGKLGAYSVKIDISIAASTNCSYILPVTSRSVKAEAGTGEIKVTADASCTWAASSNESWISITSNRSTSGSGSVRFSYEENTSFYSSTRTGIITVAGQTYTLTQYPIQPDTYEVNNTVEQASLLAPVFTQNTSYIDISANLDTTDDIDIYKINSGNDTYEISGSLSGDYSRFSHGHYFDGKLSWSTDAGATWIVYTERWSRLSVKGTIYLKVESDDTYYRHSTGPYLLRLSINTAATAGCTYSLPVASRQTSWEAGSAKPDVETGATCAWSAYTNTEWITLKLYQSRTGSGSMDYSYTENASTTSRTGTIMVAGHTYTVTQGAIQPDEYEVNNTVEQANRSAFTAAFIQNASTISISKANCHHVDDVDIYKINLGTDPCLVRSVLYDSANQINYNSHYTLNAQISCSTDGSAWSKPTDGQLPDMIMKGTLYLKIESYLKFKDYTGRGVGTYAVKIDMHKAASPDCTYRLPAADKQVTWERGSAPLSVETNSSCVWAALSNVSWITVNPESRTGSGSVRYYYEENTTANSRTGTLTVAGKTHTVTQAPLQPDAYEENNTMEQANLRPALTPEFNQNTGRISISSVNCHTNEDVDIYKINLADSCIVSVDLYHLYHYESYANRHTLDAKISRSTDGILWQYPRYNEISNTGAKGTFYLKIQPAFSNSSLEGSKGSYALKIDIKKALTAGCTYSLTASGREATAEAGTGQAEIITNPSCAWTAASNAEWITLTSGQSGTGSGSINYTYTENTEIFSRQDSIKVADQIYIITQAAAQPLSPDGYEPNETKETAYSLKPVFTQNMSTLSISPANCHHAEDVDFYKINLGTEYNSYTVTGTLYDKASDTKNHTLYAQVSWSTDGSGWHKPENGRWWELTLPGGILYLKIVRSPDYSNGKPAGSYAAKIDIIAGCSYSLSPDSRHTAEAGSGQVTVTTKSSNSLLCPWTAVANVDWIAFTSGQSGTGSGSVAYIYTKNSTLSSRTGTITIAGKSCTVTQEASPPLSPDGYEANNTGEEARLLTPVFTQNVGTVSISPANCHTEGDLDFYKINFGTDYDSYTVTGVLYDRDNQMDNSSYTLDAAIFYSTKSSAFTNPLSNRLPSLTMWPGETLYLKIAPQLSGSIGTYAAKIDIIGGCTYTLPTKDKGVGNGAGSGQLAVNSISSGSVSCPRIATSNADWITLTSGMRTTGAGDVGYSFSENTQASPRTGTILVAGHTYTLTQAGRPLPPDAYEPNNTIAKATLLTPVFTQNAGTLSILQVNCHHADDVDIYKINLEAGSYTIHAVLYDLYNDKNYTLDAKISCSTDGATWGESKDSRLQEMTKGGKLYFRIEPVSGLGTYAAKIDVLKATADCTYDLRTTGKQATYEAGSDQVIVTTGSSCAWTTTANVTWITLTSNPSQTGSGKVNYSYTENMSMDSRTGILIIAGQTYTVTQPAHPLSADKYEENNTVEQANAHSSFTPAFTQKESSISISPANCHHTEDVDFYKINLETGHSYAVSTVLYDKSNQINSNNYDLDARISCSTDGSTWSKEYHQLPHLTVQGTLYLKIAPYSNGNRVGFYAAKADIKITEDCTCKLSPASKEGTAAAGSDKIEVSLTGSLCEWTATSNSDWITITSGQSGKGSGSVEYTYTENKTAASRTGTLTVGGQTFTVTQSVVTGIETTHVKIFPNPAGDFVTIDFSGSNHKYVSVKIANQLGQILYVKESPNQTLQISLKGFAGGVYFIFLQGEEKMWVQKLVVK